MARLPPDAVPSAAPPAPRRRFAAAAERMLAPAVFLIALAVRLVPLPATFGAERILPGGLADEFYHLRRIWYSVVHFPEVLSFDSYVSFPEGGPIHWPPGFDWAVAALARLLVGAEDQGAVETLAVWVPALLGALTAVLALWVGRAAFGGLGGAVAGLGLAVLPAHSGYSQLGAIDHHVAVALAAVVALGAAMAWLRAAPSPLGARGAARSLALGLALAVPLLAWPGFLIHVAITQVVLVAALLAAAERRAAVGRAGGLAIAHAAAAAVVLPFCLGEPLVQYGAWSPLVLSRFQLVWLGAGAGVLSLCAVLWRGRLGEGRSRRVAVALALATAGVALALAAAPGLREALLYASGWFAKAEEFQLQVAELAPLGRERAFAFFSYAMLLFPVAWLGLAANAVRRRALDQGLLLLWAAVLLVLALQQNRFSNSSSVPYVLVWGGAVALGARALRARLAEAPFRRRAAAIAASALALLALAPVLRFHEGHLRRSLALRAGPQVGAATLPRGDQRTHYGAALWLGRATPPTRGYLDASVRPEYGVLAPWYAGHLLRYVAERPMVQDNFGVYGGREAFARARAYYAATDEAEARALLERMRVRYVVANRSGAGLASLDPSGPRTMTYRLARLFGSAGAARDPETGRRIEVPALAHHRMVYHARSSPGEELYAEAPGVSVAVYEHVEGARVEGRARPEARVEARLRMTTQGGRRHLPRASRTFVYHARGRADASGRYRLTLPYSTDVPFSDVVRVLGRYEIESGDRRAELGVPEDAVRSGGRVAGPSLVREPTREAPREDEERRAPGS